MKNFSPEGVSPVEPSATNEVADYRKEMAKKTWTRILELGAEQATVFAEILKLSDVKELTDRELDLKRRYYIDPFGITREEKERGVEDRTPFGRYIAMPAVSGIEGLPKLKNDYDVIYVTDVPAKLVIPRREAEPIIDRFQACTGFIARTPFEFYTSTLNCLDGFRNYIARMSDGDVSKAGIELFKISRQQIAEQEQTKINS